MTTDAATPDAEAVRDDAAVARFVERFAELLVQGGMARMPARVFARLLATDSGRLTAGELGASLKASPAAISGAIRYLLQVDMCEREREPGSRRDHYLVKSDIWYEALAHRDAMLQRWVEGLADGVTALGPSTPAGARVRETQEFLAFMRRELPGLLERWREHKADLLAL